MVGEFMKIATVLFTYNRSFHTQKVLDALKRNEVLPDKLFIFQDGLKKEEHREEWNRVKDIIRSVGWCDVEIIESEKNKGLAKAIVYGLNYVFNNNDAVIVLEDDCVTHPLFMKYMNGALRYYEKEEQVYSIGGYGWPVDVKPNGTDVYFTRRVSSWGWATWKRKWTIYEEDYKILGRIKKDESLSKQLYFWGRDLENYILGNIYGYCDSWATFWALNVIMNEGYCVAPYYSLVDNIGMDGTGVHCGSFKEEIRMLDDKCKKEFKFCNDYHIEYQTELNFAEYFSWISREARSECYYRIMLKWMQLHLRKKTINTFLDKKDIRKICIWGKGEICNLLLQELDENREILAIIESKPTLDEYQGIEIRKANEIPEETQLIILIPEYDKEVILGKLSVIWKDKVLGISEILECTI